MLIANECVHSRNRDRILSLICKLDLEKAYDRVRWIGTSPIFDKNGVWY